MLILILIDVQYLQNVVLSFEVGLNGQISPQIPTIQEKIPSAKFLITSIGGILLPLTLFGKSC